MKKFFCVVICIVIIGGCAPKRLTREESLALREQYDSQRTRIYENASEEEVLNAVDELFRLADEDYELSHGKHGCMAHRKWSAYLVVAAVFGQDYWYIQTQEVDNGVKIVIREVTIEDAVSGNPYTGVQNMPDGMENIDVFSRNEMERQGGLYQVFFARLDHLLGKTEEWVSCYGAEEIASEFGEPSIILGPLCSSAHDKWPESAKDCKEKELKKRTLIQKEREQEMGKAAYYQ